MWPPGATLNSLSVDDTSSTSPLAVDGETKASVSPAKTSMEAEMLRKRETALPISISPLARRLSSVTLTIMSWMIPPGYASMLLR